ncbi:tetratricopeptide repeat protein [Azospirillum doebereinerae]
MDFPGAIRSLRRCARLDPSNPDIYLNLGRVCFLAGHFDLAEAALSARLTFEPSDAEAMEMLGSLLQQCGRLDEAIRLQRRTMADGGSETARLRLARCTVHAEIARTARRAGLPKGLVVRGAFRESTGYGHAVRQFVRRFVEAGLPVQLIDRLSTATGSKAPESGDPFFERLDRPVHAKAVLNFTTPIEVERIPGLKTLNYTFFEAMRIPDLWAMHSRRHDHVLVATDSCRDAWIAAGHPGDRISVCPLGVTPIDHERVPKVALPDPRGGSVLDRRLRFVNVSEVTGRKNIEGLLRTWLRTTRATDDCALILKAGTTPEAAAVVRGIAQECAAAVGVSPAQAAPVFTISGRYTDDEMMSLLASGTHYWSMSHGEGWDLPMTQAAALGLTPIAPRHSAYLAYLTPETAHFLPCAVAEAEGAYSGLFWWNPDEEEAGRLLRRLIDAPDGGRRSARDMLRSRLDWDDSARRLIAELERLGAL